MADVYDYIVEQGVIVADAGTILNEVSTEYQDTFGQQLVVPDSLTPTGASTPQGLLIISEALARIAVANNNAALANQINPNVSGGIFLDAIMALTGIARTPARSSTVFATVNGVSGTIIPAGSQASETGSGNNNVFQTVIDVTIPVAGFISNVEFQSVLTGQIPCDAGTLTTIISNVLGWESITLNTQAVLGADTQSDVQARIFRNFTLASQGSAVAEAIIAGILQVPGVLSTSFLENISGITRTIQGVSMVGHSIYACVNYSALTSFTVVLATLTGVAATVVPAGSQISDGSHVFQLLTTVTIPASGTLVGVLFQSVNIGAFVIPPGTLTTIVTPVTGWNAVTNPAYALTNNQQAVGTFSTVLATVTGTPTTVIPAGSQASANGQVFETVLSTTIPGGGSQTNVLFQAITTGAINVGIGELITIVTPVAGWASVTNPADGTAGVESTIAQALVSKKSAGANYNNGPGTNIQATVKVPYSGQNMVVLFDVPTLVPINVLVTVRLLSPIQFPTTAIQQAITNYANGLIPNIAGLTVGQDVSSFELAGAITSQHPEIYVASLLISLNPATPTSSVEIPITVYQVATIAPGNIQVNYIS